MGNTHSNSSTRRHSVPLQSESTETSNVSHLPSQDAPDSTEANQTPAEENISPPNVIQRRGSFMKFPSLRRRPRSVVGLSDPSPDPQTLGSLPPPRRRWGALTGLKSRPVSALATPSSAATVVQSPRDTVEPSIPDPPHNEKGKERETDVLETVQVDRADSWQEEDCNDVMAVGSSTNVDDEPGPSSEALLQELRDLQDTLSAQEECPNDGVVPESGLDAGSSRNQVDRPPTPIPPSGMSTTSGTRGHDALDNDSPIALAEALGSWMSGHPRPENGAILNDCPIASSSGSQRTEYSPSYASAYNNEFNSASSSQAVTSPETSSSNTLPPEPSISSNGIGQSSSSPRGPTLPPAGTGTLVVVQGVVHTTDVRHSNTRTTSTSRPTLASPMHPSRSSSSTPTLRTPTLSPSSRSGSGTSTPQAPSTPRRSRLSSFASGFRQRSRPHTPTSSFRTTAPSGRRHGAGESNSSSIGRSEIFSDRSLGGLGFSSERSVSDSEAGSIALSPESLSTSPVASTDDTSSVESIDGNTSREGQAARDPFAPQAAHIRNPSESVGASANSDAVGERRAADDGEREVTSDEESEAELSASSIEILGTLLSVATAATAASLVTGTTEPLFTSGLAGPPPGGSSAIPPSQNGSTENPAPPLQHSRSPVGAENGADAAANTRMRAAWESLRERFSRTRGRRGGTASDSPGEAREDPREQMLREMARVFNMRLGLDAEGANDSRPEQQENGTSEAPLSEVSSSDTQQPLPDSTADQSNRPISEERGTGLDPGLEGSFERFLHNLQVDLRTALTDDYAARRARAQNRGVHASNVGAAASANPLQSSLSSNPSEASSSSNVAPVPSPSIGTTAPLPPDHILESSSEGSGQETPAARSSQESAAQATDLVPTVPNTPRSTNLDLPYLPGEVNSQYADGSRAPPQAQGITGQPGAGINWWRLYRFPPMQLAPHPSSISADPVSAAGIHSSPSSQPTPSSQNPVESSQEPQLPSTDQDLPSRGSEGAPTQNVVPVIVVGLQSVPVGRADPHHHDPPSPHADHFPSRSDHEFTDPPGRDRAWPLRAASRAFNRMGRRAESDATPESNMNPPTVNAAEDTGVEVRRTGRHNGRTYLIFVIGGYYPPNHSIVTGTDDMNSFEALWELADLLGQVKPPVASKEDIEKSGLEIIRSSSLPEYEKLGKVASNTVERCLICLDNYEPEDDLRLLSCRHIFHKSCVDRWLEQGRNNCPACRSKGVQTDDDSTLPSPVAGTPLRPQSGT